MTKAHGDTQSSSEAFPAYVGEPGAVYGWTDREGSQRELKANADGVVRPEDRDAERILQGMGLRIVEGERKAAARSGGSRKAAASAPADVAKVEGTRAGDEPAGSAEGSQE